MKKLTLAIGFLVLITSLCGCAESGSADLQNYSEKKSEVVLMAQTSIVDSLSMEITQNSDVDFDTSDIAYISYSVAVTSSTFPLLKDQTEIKQYLAPFVQLNYAEDSSVLDMPKQSSRYFYVGVYYNDGTFALITILEDGMVCVNSNDQVGYKTQSGAIDAEPYYSTILMKFACIENIASVSCCDAHTDTDLPLTILTEQFEIDLFLNAFSCIRYTEDESLLDNFDELLSDKFYVDILYNGSSQPTTIVVDRDGSVYVDYKGQTVYVAPSGSVDAGSFYEAHDAS